MLSVGNLSLSNPVLLAPMAGITDLPFRRLVSRFGAGLVVSEMVASGEFLSARAAARARAEIDPACGPPAVQIAGREAASMALAARMCADQGAALIDINMGCPAKKVTGGLSGSALMRTPDHALRLVEAVLAVVSIPVSVKMRLGWDAESLNAAEIARRCEGAGVAMLTVHGRTRCQFYSGKADWAAIAAVKAAVRVPVIANGDIVDTRSAADATARSGADGVMIGRAARGQPWLPAQIHAARIGRAGPVRPRGAALAALMIEHYEAMLGFYGTALGLRVARKHLGWYLEPLGAVSLRRALMQLDTPRAVIAVLKSGLADLPEAA
ncbi:MAG: tRNA dihydrouridine synthase DusB [Pseudomonadota bacterium]